MSTMGAWGKLFAPLQNTGLDPVGKWTNKQLGLVEKPPDPPPGPSPYDLQQAARKVASDKAARDYGSSSGAAATVAESEEEKRRKMLAAQQAGSTPSTGQTVLAQAESLGE